MAAEPAGIALIKRLRHAQRRRQDDHALHRHGDIGRAVTAGLEPDRPESGWKWDLGIARYEETRDSGANFFFEQLPAGEYTFKYRLRANLAGEFRSGPAQVQSIYAPEFVAYSAGERLRIEAAPR